MKYDGSNIFSANKDEMEIVKILIKNGASINMKNAKNKTALTYASANGTH